MEPNQTQLPSTDTGPGAGPQAAALQAPLPQVAVPAGPTLEQQQNLREMRSLRDEFAALRRLVMVSLADWNAMEETLHLMSSPANAERIAAAVRQLESCEGVERELIEP